MKKCATSGTRRTLFFFWFHKTLAGLIQGLRQPSAMHMAEFLLSINASGVLFLHHPVSLCSSIFLYDSLKPVRDSFLNFHHSGDELSLVSETNSQSPAKFQVQSPPCSLRSQTSSSKVQNIIVLSLHFTHTPALSLLSAGWGTLPLSLSLSFLICKTGLMKSTLSGRTFKNPLV